MATQSVQPGPIPRQWQSFINKIKRGLKAVADDESGSVPRTLLEVLESLPFKSFTSREVTLCNTKAISFIIGFREQSDGILLQSNACILLDNNEVRPPVLFCDEMPAETGSDASPRLVPRAATSLLRKANNLSPPFRFLQFDGGNKIRNVRNMVCALVLYYGLMSGLSDAAIKWNQFEVSLTQALVYIESNFDYLQWLDALAEARDTTADEPASISKELGIGSIGQVEEALPSANKDYDREGWAIDGT